MGEIKIIGYQCERCSHTWVPKKNPEKPTVCPKCKSPYWDRPRKSGGKRIERRV